jgi:hypothetical protein
VTTLDEVATDRLAYTSASRTDPGECVRVRLDLSQSSRPTVTVTDAAGTTIFGYCAPTPAPPGNQGAGA